MKDEAQRTGAVFAGPSSIKIKERLSQKVDSLDLSDRVTFSGMLIGAEKWAAFGACSIFALASHQENFGIAVVEALSCGKPVLVSNKVNIWREIEAFDAGFVDEDSIPGTLRSLRRWAVLSDGELSVAGHQALTCFHTHFNIEARADELVRILGMS